METDTIRLTRDALYDQVWSEPMSTLAPKYGLSDVGLAKICRKIRVPVPGRGYWRKKEVGQPVRRAPLPKLPPAAGSEMREVVFRPPVPGNNDGSDGPIARQERFEADEEHRIKVPEALSAPHPLVAQTVAALRRAKPDTQGCLQPKGPCLAVQVTLDSADRALCVLDALLKALDVRGYPTALRAGQREGERHATVVRLGDEDVAIALAERVEEVRPASPDGRPAPAARGPRYPLAAYSSQTPAREWTATGQLSLRIEHSYLRARRTWADGKQQRLEECLNAFIVGLVTAAEELKAQRLAREAREREWQAAEERRAADARRREAEAGRVRALDSALLAWRTSRLVREYAAALRAAAEAAEGGLVVGSPLAEWIAWADGYADRIDPLRAPLVVPKDPEPHRSTSYAWGNPAASRPSLPVSPTP